MKAWKNDKRFLKVITAVMIVGIFVLAPETTYAVDLFGVAAAGGNALLNSLATIVITMSNMLGSLVLTVLELILLPIIQYSDFIGHPVVTNGWTIVRDLMNTGFIVLMLIIAFGTMFGISRFNWTQQIPRLVIAAIAINFSRLITGLFIDIGQVIMIGFVNALQQVGIGNFLQLLKLTDLQSQVGGSLTIDGASNLGSAIMALMMTAIVLVVIGVIAAVLVYRIVILWVLIIMSPAAFLAGAAQGILSQAAGMYSQWWGKLTAAIMIGPILTFFLWLALASVNGMTQGFDTNRNPPPEGAIINNSIVTNDNFTGFVIGIALLLAGLEMATSTAGQLGGFASKVVGFGSNVSKKLAAAPLAAVGTASLALGRRGVQGARAVGAYGVNSAASMYRGRTQERRVAAREKQRAKAEANISRGGFFGGISNAYGQRQLAKVGSEEAKEKAIQADLSKKYTGLGRDWGAKQKLEFVKNNTSPGASEERRAQAMAISSSLVNDEAGFAAMVQNPQTRAGAFKMMSQVKEHQALIGDAKGEEKMKKMLAKNPQWAHTNSTDLANALEDMTPAERAGIDKRAWGDANFRNTARSTGVFDDMFTGSKEEKAEARKGMNKGFIKAAERHLTASAVDIARDTAEQKRYESAVDLRRGKDMTKSSNKERAASDDAIHGLINSNLAGMMGASVSSGSVALEDMDYASVAPGTRSEIDKAIDNALTRKGSAAMVQSLQNASDNGAGNEKIRADEMLKAVKASLGRIGGAANKSARVAIEGNADASFGYDSGTKKFRGSGADKAKKAREFSAGLASDPTIILKLDKEMSDMGGEMARVAAESVTKKTQDAMVKAMRKAKGTNMEAVHREAIKRQGKLLEDYDKHINSANVKATEAMKEASKANLRHHKKRIMSQLDV